MGARGFTPREFQEVLEQAAEDSLKGWLDATVERPGELDYAPALAWYGLRFASGSKAGHWRLEVDPAATPVQAARWRALLPMP